MFGGDGVGAPEAASDTAAHFCCTLVIAPPGASPAGSPPGGTDITACWGWPPPDAVAAVAGMVAYIVITRESHRQQGTAVVIGNRNLHKLGASASPTEAVSVGGVDQGQSHILQTLRVCSS
jgi:hypothetical protein